MADAWALKAIISAQDNLSPVLRNVARASLVAHKAISDIGSAGVRLGSNIAGALAPLGALTGLISAGGLAVGVTEVIKTTSAFEKMQTTLEVIEGSAAKAKASMSWVSDFATKTPYEVNEVTQAFVKLKGYGIDPQKGALQAAGNAASSMGKPLMQAVEAIADAMTGENERLKEFGITSKKTGNDVVYSWVENGKKMATKVAAGNQAAIEKAIRGIWDRRFGGGMDKQAKTFDGIVSNIKDVWTRFLLTIGQSGIFDAVKAKLSALLDQLNRWSADGTLERVAKLISEHLVAALTQLEQWIMRVDWATAWDGIKQFATHVQAGIAAVGGLSNVAIGLAAVMGATLLAPTVSMIAALVRMGVGLVSVTASAAGSSAAVTALGASMSAATASAAGLLGKLGALGAAGAAGYGVGSMLNDQITKRLEASTGVQGMSLGSWLYDKVHGTDVAHATDPSYLVRKRGSAPTVVTASDASGAVAAAARPMPRPAASLLETSARPAQLGGTPSLLQSTRDKPRPLTGEIRVSFENAPPGLRVSPGRTNQDVSLNPDVGYGAVAMGLP